MATRRRVLLLVLLLAAAAASLFAGVVLGLLAPNASPGLPWLAWVVAFAAAEVFVVHVQLQRDSHSFSLTDLVFVAGSTTRTATRPATCC